MKPEEYEEIFSLLKLPEEIKLWPGVYIKDVNKFIESHLLNLKSVSSERQKEQHIMRLYRVIDLLKNDES